MSSTTKLQLGFSPLTKTIQLAKMRDMGEGQRLRVGNDQGRDVTNEAAQLVWQLVIAEGGEISWKMPDGCQMILKAEKKVSNMLSAQQLPVVPEGWQIVPIEPTEHMVVSGFESEPDKFFSPDEVWEAYEAMSGCGQAAHRAKLCWAAMLSAAPKFGGEPDNQN